MIPTLLGVIFAVIQVVYSAYPSGRTVYNLHTRPTHWASARATCAGYDAHLVTVDSAQALQANLETLDALDWSGAFASLMETSSVWTGLYRSTAEDGTDYLAWDKCTTFTSASQPNGDIQDDLVAGSDYCVSMARGYILEPRACQQELPFICQLELGQCWFLPLEGQSFARAHDLALSADLHDCARECRNHISVAGECWGFLEDSGTCKLYIDDTSHVFIRDPTNHLLSDSSSTAHVKVCTGDKITSELIVNPTETSKAQRKLSSADDPRPSAKSVGGFGIAILTIVFGGLIVLDLRVLLKQITTFSWVETKKG
ncbi:sushi, von Willebrand factor type a, egf and pentraxin domain-containing protein 1 [Plakobranchus ocellatus]|uniref:Sushi, von Willebrand factor type a, egf and pentraxin domain-containing protein 1 n=1 Tax=Plakobranchus ocellatus TaxID=259542 RepID=A0AAV4AQ74_9GAST|nr:sushi, von Willebrand factor type a, egf and pentraxin domain-containing protein 1 [Plakobranchus ocellatus]